ncbi:MAG: hypothetical protein RJP95_02715 [Pirellulales bacterium]
MSNYRLQVGIRGLLVLVLAFACFFGGWTAHDRMQETEADHYRMFHQHVKKEVADMWKRSTDSETRALKFEAENNNFKQQVKVFEQMVETLNAEIEEINAVMDRPPSS